VLDVDVIVPRRHFDVSVALAVASGERFALFGPSGSGKTTVLDAVAGLVDPVAGHVILDGVDLFSAQGVGCRERARRDHGYRDRALRDHGRRDRTRRDRPAVVVPPWLRRVGLVRQRPDLFPHLSVAANLVYARDRVDDAHLAHLVEVLGIAPILDARPAGISGGQAQRVALARALATRHRALLLDEPYTALDAALRRELTALVRSEARTAGVPAILVAHELGEAQAFADRMGVIDGGALLQVGKPDEVVRLPASRRVAELVGYRGFVPLAGGARTGGRLGVVAGVHPERVRLGADPAVGPVLDASVVDRRPAGAGWEVDLAVCGTAVSCRVADDPPSRGTALSVTLLDPPLFAATGEAVGRSVAGSGR
jgi:ABC-type Fe3+/spermidine/putrescine transport system ATPase subunit